MMTCLASASTCFNSLDVRSEHQFMEPLDVGAITTEQTVWSMLAHQLTSAVGGAELTPSLGLVDLQPHDVLLLCADGLTKHVSDERITMDPGQPWTAEQMAVQLTDEALARGGTDNISIVVARILE